MLKDLRGEINTGKSPFDVDYSEDFHAAMKSHIKNSSDEDDSGNVILLDNLKYRAMIYFIWKKLRVLLAQLMKYTEIKLERKRRKVQNKRFV